MEKLKWIALKITTLKQYYLCGKIYLGSKIFNTRKPHVAERAFKSSPLHASVIFQIHSVHWLNSVNFCSI